MSHPILQLLGVASKDGGEEDHGKMFVTVHEMQCKLVGLEALVKILLEKVSILEVEIDAIKCKKHKP